MAQEEATNWFGDRLRRAMDEAKLKPGDLTRATGARPGTVSRWLSGEIRPREKNLRKLADALNKPLHKKRLP